MNNKETLGILAEDLVKKHFESLGSAVEYAVDKFDDEKDLIIDGAITEVKFQTIYHYFKSYDRESPYPAFTVPVTYGPSKVAQNQLDKCLNASRWIVVQNPSSLRDETTVKVWEAPPLGQRRFKLAMNRNDGRIIAGFPLTSFKLLVDIKDAELYNRIKRLDISKFS